MEQVSLWEVNEAFAVTAIIFIRDMGLANADRVNVRGGAVALGHPIGLVSLEIFSVECAYVLICVCCVYVYVNMCMYVCVCVVLCACI